MSDMKISRSEYTNTVRDIKDCLKSIEHEKKASIPTDLPIDARINAVAAKVTRVQALETRLTNDVKQVKSYYSGSIIGFLTRIWDAIFGSPTGKANKGLNTAATLIKDVKATVAGLSKPVPPKEVIETAPQIISLLKGLGDGFEIQKEGATGFKAVIKYENGQTSTIDNVDLKSMLGLSLNESKYQELLNEVIQLRSPQEFESIPKGAKNKLDELLEKKESLETLKSSPKPSFKVLPEQVEHSIRGIFPKSAETLIKQSQNILAAFNSEELELVDNNLESFYKKYGNAVDISLTEERNTNFVKALALKDFKAEDWVIERGNEDAKRLVINGPTA